MVAACSEGLRQTHERLGELLAHEHASIGACAAMQWRSGAPHRLFTTLLNYRYAQLREATSRRCNRLRGSRCCMRRSGRTIRSVLSVDDLGKAIGLVRLQASAGIEPRRICELMQHGTGRAGKRVA